VLDSCLSKASVFSGYKKSSRAPLEGPEGVVFAVRSPLPPSCIEHAAHHPGRLSSLAPWCQKAECSVRRLRRHGFEARRSLRPPDSRHVDVRSSIT
jgi:hypothetical protein